MLFQPVPAREPAKKLRKELCDYFFEVGQLSKEEEDFDQPLFCSYKIDAAVSKQNIAPPADVEMEGCQLISD